jgi:hypothetical protein
MAKAMLWSRAAYLMQTGGRGEGSWDEMHPSQNCSTNVDRRQRRGELGQDAPFTCTSSADLLPLTKPQQLITCLSHQWTNPSVELAPS